MLSLILGLVGVIVGLVIQYIRGKGAQALLDNVEVKNKLNQIDQQISKNAGTEAALEEQRKQQEQDMKDKENANVSKDDLLKFLNDPNKQS